MRIAVSGAGGLIGSAICRSLRGAGHTLQRLTRPGGSRPAQPEDLVWQPESGLVEPEKLNSVDAFIHLAGHSIGAARWTVAEKSRIRDSRVASTEKLVSQIVSLENPPRVIISASAIGLYGDQSDRLVDESSEPADTFLGRVARDWEAACDPLRKLGCRVVHPRLAMVLTKQGGALEKVIPLFRWWLGGRLGSGQQYWSWIALADVVHGISWLLARDDVYGPVNFSSPQPVTNAEFTRKLAEAMHKPVSVPVPAIALRLALGEMADELLLTSCRVQPTQLLSHGFQFQYPQLKNFLQHELRASS